MGDTVDMLEASSNQSYLDDTPDLEHNKLVLAMEKAMFGLQGAFQDMERLDNVQEILTQSNGEMDDASYKLATQYLESIAKTYASNELLVVESREGATRKMLVTESIGNFFRRIWEMVLATFRWIRDGFARLFEKMMGSAKIQKLKADIERANKSITFTNPVAMEDFYGPEDATYYAGAKKMNLTKTLIMASDVEKFLQNIISNASITYRSIKPYILCFQKAEEGFKTFAREGEFTDDSVKSFEECRKMVAGALDDFPRTMDLDKNVTKYDELKGSKGLHAAEFIEGRLVEFIGIGDSEDPYKITSDHLVDPEVNPKATDKLSPSVVTRREELNKKLLTAQEAIVETMDKFNQISNVIGKTEREIQDCMKLLEKGISKGEQSPKLGDGIKIVRKTLQSMSMFYIVASSVLIRADTALGVVKPLLLKNHPRVAAV